MSVSSILAPLTPPGAALPDAGTHSNDIDAALARYRAIAVELAEAERQHPEVALHLARLDFDTYLSAAIALIDHVTAERDDALAQVEELATALDEAEGRLVLRASLDRDKIAILWDQRAEIAVLRDALHDTDRDERRASFNAKHPIADVARRAIHLEPSGDPSHLRGYCPWCADDGLHVYTQYGRYLCASCRTRGTAREFVAHFPRQEAYT
jgi:hypothetical protein